MDWLLILSSLLLPVVPLFFFGNCPCCPGVVTCGETICDAGTSPAEMNVTFDGFSDDSPFGCSTCELYNGLTVVVPYVSSCLWSIDQASKCPAFTTNDRVTVTLSLIGTDVRLQVSLQAPGGVYGGKSFVNAAVGTAPIACVGDITDIPVPISADGTYFCLYDGTDAIVTAS